MQTVTEAANAKINLYLEVTGIVLYILLDTGEFQYPAADVVLIAEVYLYPFTAKTVHVAPFSAVLAVESESGSFIVLRA